MAAMKSSTPLRGALENGKNTQVLLNSSFSDNCQCVCVCVKKANSLYCIEERRQDGWLSACCVPLSLWVKLWFHVKIKLFLKNFRVAWNHV